MLSACVAMEGSSSAPGGPGGLEEQLWNWGEARGLFEGRPTTEVNGGFVYVTSAEGPLEKITPGLQARAARPGVRPGASCCSWRCCPAVCAAPLRALGFQAVCSFQAPSLQLPFYRAAQAGLSLRGGDPGSVPPDPRLPGHYAASGISGCPSCTFL